jgi:hypothetical protein
MIPTYRILTYILLPFALLFGVLAVITLFVALANPALFLPVFISAAFAIYWFCSFRFLSQGILRQQSLNPKLRDWLRVNAFVALPFAVMNFMQSFTIISKPSLVSEVVKQMLEMQQRMSIPPQPAASYEKMIMAILYVMLVFSLILLVHLMLSFSLVKKYKGIFEGKTEE